MLSNMSSFNTSSRRLPLKDSMKAFCCGLPGSMSCHSASLSFAHFRIARLVNSAALSLTMLMGFP